MERKTHAQWDISIERPPIYPTQVTFVMQIMHDNNKDA